MPVRVGTRYQVRALPEVGMPPDPHEHAEPVCLHSPAAVLPRPAWAAWADAWAACLVVGMVGAAFA